MLTVVDLLLDTADDEQAVDGSRGEVTDGHACLHHDQGPLVATASGGWKRSD
jgi:hypothetical protein